MKIGTENIENLMMGSEQVSAIAMGSEVVWSGSTPTPYTPLNYIQTDGDCYFDTGIIPSIDTVIEISNFIPFSGTMAYGVYIGGCYDDWNNTGISLRRENATSKFGLRFGNFYNSNYNCTMGDEYSVYLDKTRFTYGNVTQNLGVSSMSSGNIYSMYIGAEHNRTGAFRPSIAQFGEVKIYTGATIVADLIPVTYQGSIGFWDLIGDTFCPNLGNGTPTGN